MTVIRDVTVRLKLEQEKARLENPGSGVSSAYHELDKAAKEAAASIREAIAANKDWGQQAPQQNTSLESLAAAIREALGAAKEWGKEIPKQKPALDAWAEGLKRVNDEWRKGGSGRDSWAEGLNRMRGQREEQSAAAAKAADEASKATREMIGNFREGGEGALRMARGIAFLSASGSEDLQKLIRTVAVAQGAFDVFSGGTKMAMNLAKVFGGPLAIAVTGVTAAVTVGGLAWSRYHNELERVKKKAEETERALKESAKASVEALRAEAAKERGHGTTAAERERSIGTARTESAIRDKERNNRLAEERALLDFEMAGFDRPSEVKREQLERIRSGETRRDRERRGAPGFEIRAGDIADKALALKYSEDLIAIEGQRVQISERQRDIIKDQYKIESQRMADQGALYAAPYNIAGALAFAGGAAGLTQGAFSASVSQGINNQTKTQIEILTKETQQALDTLLDVIRDARRRADQLRRDLDAANPD